MRVVMYTWLFCCRLGLGVWIEVLVCAASVCFGVWPRCVCVCLFAMCPKRGVSAAALKVVHESWFSITGHDVQEGMQ